MPNYSDAPWNAPVEDEGKELSDADIPTRRRKPGEKKEDVLTELIFGSYATPKKVEQPRQPEPKPAAIRPNVAPAEFLIKKKESDLAKKETSTDKRTRLLKELEELEKKEKEIASSLRTFERPFQNPPSSLSTKKTAATLAPLLSQKKGGRKRVTSSSFKNVTSTLGSPLAKLDGLQKEPSKSISAALPISVPATLDKKLKYLPAPSRMDAIVHTVGKKERAEPKNDVQEPAPVVGTTEPVSPTTEPTIPVLQQPVAVAASLQSLQTEQKIYDYYTKDHEHPKKRRITKQLATLSFAFVIVAGVLGVIDNKRLPTSFAFLSNISGFLRQNSFALSDQNKESFPQLAQLYDSVEQARSQFSSSKELDEIKDSLEKFFSSNETFLWTDYFNGKGTELKSVSELANILKQKKLFEAAHEHVLLIDSNTLTETLTWLSFMGELFKDDAKYLVLTTDTLHPTSSGGEPMYYSVLEISQGTAKITKTGSAKDLNAALATKIIPPTSVQGIKTDFDLFEAGWFYTFTDVAALITLMYEQTTQEKIDGVILVTDSSAESLMKAAGVSGELSQTWLQDVLAQLGTGLYGASLSERIHEEIDRGAIQVAFEQNSFSSFARGKLNLIAETETMDSITASLRVWEGGGAEISLLEYSPHFYTDGSIVGNASVSIKNLDSESTRAYLKIYIPKQSMILDAQGYGQKISPAPFDYSGEGFAQHALINSLNERASEEFVLLDLYDEGEFLVVGGWVMVSANDENLVKLSYRIPSRLDWRAGNARYDLTILPMAAGRDVPFRFSGVLEEGVTFDWKEPLGHVAQQTAEFQKALTSLIKLSSSVGFTEPPASGEPK